MINVFLRIAKQGDEIPVETGISMIFSSSFISRNSLNLFVTNENDAKYCDSPGVSKFGTLRITPNTLKKTSAISVTLFLSNTKIKIIAQNVNTGLEYKTIYWIFNSAVAI